MPEQDSAAASAANGRAAQAGIPADEGEDFFSSTPPASFSSVAVPTVSQNGSLFRGGEDEDEDENGDQADFFPRSSPLSHRKREASKDRSSKRSRLDEHTEEQHHVHQSATLERSQSSSSNASTSSSTSNSSYGEWDRRFIGTFVISAYSLSKGSNYIKPGDRVRIQRQKPKLPGAVISASANGKTIAAGSAKKQTKLNFGAGPASTASKKAKVKEDYIVRFSNMRGFEVGRIPTDVSVWMSKVMDNDTAAFEGIVVDSPPVLTVGCDLLLEIRAYMLRDVFATTHANDVSFGTRTDEVPASAWGSETAESDEEKRLRERKVSLVRLFRACTLRPSKTNAVLSSHRSAEDLDFDAMLEQYGGAAQLLQQGQNGNNGTTSTPSAAHTTKPSAIATPQRRSPKPDSRSSTPEVDDGTELNENQLDSVYNRAQLHDLALPEVDPAEGFALTLRPYQKQALGWMLKMEERPHKSKNHGREEKALHPLWEEYIFPVDDERMDLLDTATSKFYFNPYTGHLSLRFQAASRGARGGILADEMGLGKTIQMASLILSNQPAADEVSDNDDENDEDDQEERRGAATPRQVSLAASFATALAAKELSPAELAARRKSMLKAASASRGRVTLVVAPMSLVGQWRDEMDRSIPSMRSMLYYAETKGDLVSRLEGGSVDIVITSYGTLVTEYKRYVQANNAQSAARTAPLYAVDWLRVILDEAHHIKNKATRNSRACRDLTARRRWCLTGTPIVNRLTDLYSLLRFLRVEPWGDFAFFNSFIAKPFMQKNPKALEIVQVVLESILMRREKRMKDKDGKPIVELPPKTTSIVRLKFTPLEREIYESVYERAYMQFQTLAAAGTVSRNFTFIFSVLMRLRQAVCHPLLVLKGAKTVSKTDANKDTEEDENRASVLGEAEEKVKELVAAFQAGHNSASEDSGEEKVSREVLEQLFGDNAAEEEGAETECPFCFEEKSELLVMPCKHWGCKACVMDHLQRSEERGEEEATCPTCRTGPVTLGNSASVVRTRQNRLAQAIQGSQGGGEEDAENCPSSQPAVFFRSNDFRSSTKLEALVEHLNQLRYDDPTFKGVIFSQFTSFLDLVEVVLRKNHHAFVRLDGTTSQKDREAVLKEFSNAPKRMLILVSLRAGGVGLNLVAANHVWLLDCWWNTSTEDQAVDRIHRLGQTRPVHVHRFLIDDSIEDRILAIQARKTALVGAALAGSTRGPGEKSEALENLELLFS